MKDYKFYWITGFVVFLMIIIITLVSSILNKDINKIKKISNVIMLSPTIIDNEKVIYYSPESQSISELSFVTGKITVIKKLGIGKVFTVSWSPDSTEAIINAGNEDFSVDKYWYLSISNNMILPLDEKMSEFSWSGSGKEISYLSLDPSGMSTINISLPTGASSRKLFSFQEDVSGNSNDLVWSKDDQRIAVSVGPTDFGASETFILNVKDGTKSTLSAKEAGNVENWSPNSQKISFQAFNKTANNYSLAVRNIVNNLETDLNFQGQSFWLSDSQTLIGQNETGVWKISSENKTKKKIFQPKGQDKITIDYIVKFNETTNEIYFIANNKLYKVLIKNK